MRIENGSYTAGECHPRWGLADGTRKRTFRDNIDFSEPFESPPKVVTAIPGFDIFDVGESFRASVYVQAERISLPRGLPFGSMLTTLREFAS